MAQSAGTGQQGLEHQTPSMHISSKQACVAVQKELQVLLTTKKTSTQYKYTNTKRQPATVKLIPIPVRPAQHRGFKCYSRLSMRGAKAAVSTSSIELPSSIEASWVLLGTNRKCQFG